MKADRPLFMTTAVLAVLFYAPGVALAHCDGLDGPVAKAAQQALATGNVNLVLVWVQASDDSQIKQAFTKTLAVRKLNPEAQELADLYFLETLVRVHRAGEGEPYTGLKPAGRDLGPAIPAADQAVESGSIQELTEMLREAASSSVQQRFERVLASKNFSRDNVPAGRDYVKNYVQYVHYVEALAKLVVADQENPHQSKPGYKHPAH